MANQPDVTIQLGPEKQALAVAAIQEFYAGQFGEAVSDFRAEQLVEFFCRDLGPIVYDRALEDAKSWLFEKLQDLSIDLRKEA